MKYALLLIILLSGITANAQTVLTIEGESYTNSDETWLGVNIPRSSPTTFSFKNNFISSKNLYGYLLQAGDEVTTANNNNLDGAIITGNKFTWNGTDMESIAHGLFTGHNINVNIKFNYLDHVPMGIIRKSTSNMVNTSGGVAYNIVKSPNTGIVVKGMSGVCIYNNTLYQDRSTSETGRGLIDIYTNQDVSPVSVSHNTKIYNNIFYTKYGTACINVMDQESLTGLQSDYNIYYCEAGTPKFKVAGSVKTFAEWQAMGYDSHSRVINPNFKDFFSFVPTARLDYGTNLGSSWATGLSVNAKWGTTSPETASQNGIWQVGAVIYKEVVTEPDPAPVPVFTGALINNSTPSRLEITYSLSLANILPPVSAFAVKVNSVTRSVSTVAISDKKVYLTLSGPVAYGDVITVSYSRPSSNPIQTSEGEQAESLTAHSVANNLDAPPVNQPPAVSISSPTKSTGYTAPATIVIDATASDSDGSIKKVEFYSGSTKLGERTGSPWSFTWKDVQEGSYSITAAATDNSDARTVSTAVTVVVEKGAVAVNQLPSVSISSPGENATFEAPATVTLIVDAYDPDGSIERVEYFIGQEKLSESLLPPFSFSFQCDTTGTYEITAIAYDNLSASTSSVPVTISVTTRREYPDLINLYPNPNNGYLTVDLYDLPEFEDPAILNIVNLSGRTIYTDVITTGETTRRIDISESFAGNYILLITQGDRILSTRQFIKY